MIKSYFTRCIYIFEQNCGLSLCVVIN